MSQRFNPFPAETTTREPQRGGAGDGNRSLQTQGSIGDRGFEWSIKAENLNYG